MHESYFYKTTHNPDKRDGEGCLCALTNAPLVINVLCITEVVWPWERQGKFAYWWEKQWMMFNPQGPQQLTHEDRFMKCCACTVSNGMLTDTRWIYHDSAETHRHAAQSDTLQSLLQGAACHRRKSQSACCNCEFFHITHLNTNIPERLYITIYNQICCLTHQYFRN